VPGDLLTLNCSWRKHYDHVEVDGEPFDHSDRRYLRIKGTGTLVSGAFENEDRRWTAKTFYPCGEIAETGSLSMSKEELYAYPGWQ
jgi:hypothetical protein